MRWLPLLPLVALLSGCAGGASAGQADVVAAAYPFAWLATEIAGPDAEVTNVVKPGAEPHDIELTPQQVALVKDAAVVLHVKGFQAAVDDALDGGEQGLDLGAVTEAESDDPHIWLDPVRMQIAAGAIAARLSAQDPSHADGYRSRLDVVIGKLKALDATFTTALTGCTRKELVTSHSAFGYLASRYGLVQKAISGFDPDAEPSPGKVAEIATYARSRGVTTIFFETLVDPKIAKTIAGEIGAKTAVLDPVESAAPGDDYLTIQRRNAAALGSALGCR